MKNWEESIKSDFIEVSQMSLPCVGRLCQLWLQWPGWSSEDPHQEPQSVLHWGETVQQEQTGGLLLIYELSGFYPYKHMSIKYVSGQVLTS